MRQFFVLLICVSPMLAGMSPGGITMAHAGIMLIPPAPDADIPDTDVIGQVIEGQADVIDGDTIDISGQRIKLAGIDAMELRQTCFRGGVEWHCGEDAKAWLEHFVANSEVRCHRAEADGFGDIAAHCYNAGGVSLAWVMVHWGFAIDDRVDQPNFAGSQRNAMERRRGIWSGDFVKPVVWRQDGI